MAAPREIEANETIKILRTFPPGSAAGPSGLLGLMTHPSKSQSLVPFVCDTYGALG